MNKWKVEFELIDFGDDSGDNIFLTKEELKYEIEAIGYLSLKIKKLKVTKV